MVKEQGKGQKKKGLWSSINYEKKRGARGSSKRRKAERSEGGSFSRLRPVGEKWAICAAGQGPCLTKKGCNGCFKETSRLEKEKKCRGGREVGVWFYLPVGPSMKL